MALGDFLKQKYLDLIQPVQQSLSNVGNTVSSAVQSFNQPRTNVGGSQINLTKFKPVLPTPQVNSNYYKGLQSLSNYQQGVGDYLQNRVVEPIKAAKMEFSKPGIVSKGLGALNLAQAGYNLSPEGIGTNIALGTGAGIANAKRTGQPFGKTVGQGITQNISPFQFGTGVGDKPINVAGMNVAPALAFAGDVAIMNPQNTVNAFTKAGKLTSAFRKTPPTPPMHGEDVYYLDRAIDALRDRKLKGTPQRRTAVDIIDKLAEGYLPKEIIDKTKGDTNKLIKQLQKQVGDYVGSTGNERIPGLGLIAGNQATGFKQAPNKFSSMIDKKPRFEIDDSKAVFKSGKLFSEYQDKLENVLDHPQLFKNYPELRNIKVALEPMDLGTNAMFDSKANKITLNELAIESMDARKTLIHEIQHMIQSKEGFARGGSPTMFDGTLGNLDYKIAVLEKKANLAKSDEELEPIIREINNLVDYKKNPALSYKRLGGELESRAVANRVNLTPRQRVSIDPYSGEGIPLKEVITKFDESKAQQTIGGTGKQLGQIETGQTKPVIQNNPLSSFLDEEAESAGSGKTPNLPPRLTDPVPPPLPDHTTGGNKAVFEDWVNSRRAVSPEQAIIKQQFAHLDDEGVNAFFNIQKGDPKYAAVRQFLDKKFEQVKKVGMDLGYESDYLPQVWANSEDEIARVFGKRIVTKPGFTLNKIIDDYKMGIEAGLTPKFEKVSDLLAWYEGKANKSIADRRFFNALHQSQTILPIDQAPKDWVTLNPDRFPKMRYTDSNGLEAMDTGPFKAPKEVAESVNNYLYNPEDGNGFQRALNAVANYTSRVKNVALSFGVPGTAINAHGINILTRHTLFGSGGNPLTRLATGLRYLVDPYAAQSFLQKEMSNSPHAVKAGLTLSTEDFKPFTDVIEKTGRFSKLSKTWNTLFEKRLFDQMIPALKLSSYQALEKQLGTKNAANLVNNVYGGINWEAMGRNRDFQNFLRSVILAPDWAETTVRVGANLGKSLFTKGPVATRYRTMITTIIGAYVSGNITNKLSSGHYMWENDPGHTFEIEAGYTDDGQKRYFKPFGTALDMVRIPYDISLSLAKGDLSSIARIFRNRLSIPAGVGVGFITDTNYAGQPIGYKGKDKFGNEMPIGQRVGSIAGEAAQLVGFPSFLRQAIDTASGKQGVEQGLTQGFELPFRYSGGAYSKSQQAIEKAAQTQRVKGKDLYDLNKKTQGMTLSKNQTELIKQGGIGMVDDILQLKLARSQENQLKDTVEKMQTGELSEQEGNALIEKILQTETPVHKQSSAESITPAHASSGYPAGSLVSDTTLNAGGATSKFQGASPLDEQKISLIKAKLKYGGSITNDEKQLILRPPQPPKLTGEKELDKELTQDFNSSITSKQNLIKDLYSSGAIDKTEAEKYLKDFTAIKVSTKDQLTAEKQQIDAQYSLDSDMLKRSKDTQAWISTTEEYVKYLENYKSKLTDPTAQIRVQNRIEDLKTQLSKYTKQGGFTKGRSKKLKAPKVKAIKIKIPKIKAIKTKSIKLKKVKEYKLPKVKALKSARIKVKSKLT